MVTNDNWDNHVPGAALGTITDELSAHVVLYVWNGRMLPGHSSCYWGTARATGRRTAVWAVRQGRLGRPWALGVNRSDGPGLWVMNRSHGPGLWV